MKQNQAHFVYATIAALSTVLCVREGESQEPAPITLTPAELQTQIAAAVEAATSGLKAKNTELLGSVHTLKDKTKAFDGLDLESLKALQARLDQDEDVKLLAEGKTMQVIEKHTERMRAQHVAELAAKDELIQKEAQRADSYKGHVLDSQLLAVTSGLHKSAVEDALLLGRNMFQLDAQGKAVKIGANGVVELGKDGATPFSPAEWIEQAKETKPHWFPATTSGSGSGNSREAAGSGKTIKRSEFERLPAHEQASKAQSGIQIVD